VPGRSRGQSVALEQHDILPTHVSEGVRDRGPDDAAADDDDARTTWEGHRGHGAAQDSVISVFFVPLRACTEAHIVLDCAPMRKLLFAALLLAAACKQNKSKLDDMPATKVAAAAKTTDGAIDIDSKDILDRKES